MSDLFEFFKENERKLHEKPPEKVWQKLELKLNKQQRRKRRERLFLQIGTVALALLILLFAAISVWFFVKNN